MERWFNSLWYQPAVVPAWQRYPAQAVLLPLSWLFALLAALRRLAYRTGVFAARSAAAPVIVVGNISVGGTGKTPLVVWLAGELAARGLRPGIATRGYGAHRQSLRRVSANDEASQAGDEAVWLARQTTAPVVAGRDRVAVARELAALGCDVIVSDDGLQHYALRRDCEIVVIDGDRAIGNGRQLPAGPLREPHARLRTVDAVIVNGEGAAALPALDAHRVFRVRMVHGLAYLIANPSLLRTLQSFAGERVHAIAGIGNPERFFGELRAAGLVVVGHAFPDHHDYGAEELNFGDGAAVLMTEKDAVKCAHLAGACHWAVPQRVQFEPAEAARLLATIMQTVRPAVPQ
jgi:tetraacyldisaccharide 4'-kinase